MPGRVSSLQIGYDAVRLYPHISPQKKRPQVDPEAACSF
jgi:hypothetical protein